jgi:hypothetical protein
MSLDIGLANAKTVSPYPSMKFCFDDDGYYWFCYPFFEELRDLTGEMIDLYDGAWFAGTQLDDLIVTLERIRAKADESPDEWQVRVGQSLGSHQKPTAPAPIFSNVKRERLLGLLGQFEELAREAQRSTRWVACLGD